MLLFPFPPLLLQLVKALLDVSQLNPSSLRLLHSTNCHFLTLTCLFIHRLPAHCLFLLLRLERDGTCQPLGGLGLCFWVGGGAHLLDLLREVESLASALFLEHYKSVYSQSNSLS